MLNDVVLLGDELSLLRAINGDGGSWPIPEDAVFRETFSPLLRQELLQISGNRYRLTECGQRVLRYSTSIPEGYPVAITRDDLRNALAAFRERNGDASSTAS